MQVEVALNTPLADALQNAIQSKVAEAGWSGLDDSGLAEYILLMLVNGKTAEQVAAELSTEILDVAPDDENTLSFARWLFEQAAVLKGEKPSSDQGTTSSTAPQDTKAQSTLISAPASLNGADTGDNDAVMGGSTDSQAQNTVPTGPRAMHNGTPTAPTGPKGRNKPIVGQINKTMNRTPEPSLHRIKGLANTGRINTHNHNTPRGPAPKGPRGNPRNHAPSTRMQNAMQSQVNGMMQQPAAAPTLTPQQQMQMLAMYEGMMASIMSPQQQQEMAQSGMFGIGMNGMNGMNQLQPSSRSLFDRVDMSTQRHRGGFRQHHQPRQASKDTGADGMDLTSSMEVENSSQPSPRPDPSTTLCRFNLFCTKADCAFVHQSPAAPPDTAVDMTDTCSFGAACTNKKCAGKHPSPAQKAAHQVTAECKFYPNCTNIQCPFRHPAPMCRNGADCTKPGCTFGHSTIMCKFNPCLNPMCTFKHAEGQKRGKFQDKVWINPEAEDGDGNQEHHVSERKFVDENAEEELILPDKGNQNGVQAEEVAT